MIPVGYLFGEAGFRREKCDENPCPTVFDLAAGVAGTANALAAQPVFSNDVDTFVR